MENSSVSSLAASVYSLGCSKFAQKLDECVEIQWNSLNGNDQSCCTVCLVLVGEAPEKNPSSDPQLEF